MSLSKDDIINAVAEMSVKDVVELITAMEEKFGVTAAVAYVIAISTDCMHALDYVLLHLVYICFECLHK